jgi:CII-binding regulator of phage lambda lysogenization HflD
MTTLTTEEYIAREQALNETLKKEIQEISNQLTQLVAQDKELTERLARIKETIPYLRGRAEALTAVSTELSKNN